MKKLLNSFFYAFKGLAYAFATQLNFKIHCAALVLVVFFGVYFSLERTEWLWIVVAAAQVLVVELINTAIEVLVDLVSPDFDKQAGHVKDLAAGAVLVSAFAAVVIAMLIFIPKILMLCYIK